jgi:Flp pilus assembly protein TadD
VHRLLGRTYYAQGRTDEAEAAYRRAIDLNERDAWSMNNLGLLLLETKRAEEALPLFAQAVELRKEVPEFHNNLGWRSSTPGVSGAILPRPYHRSAPRRRSRTWRASKRSERT